ncbi:DUF2705 family protein [Evansella sp. AB-P1]|uniref:ABC transporter permease n=1 Tax=Evansella sp. AB-P1 TaxID=3037653 RepID=UPI00241C5C12|nr:ABC transporter permease subunit [Evansella sp. AB-P1]MDG5788443.1 DUF2705 family protein [Evansella sp. AB-P1]
MFNLIPLIKNENMKIYKRLGTWVMIGLLFLVIVVAAFFTKFFFVEENSERWEEQLQMTNIQLIEQIEEIESSNIIGISTQSLHEQVAINEYRIENNLPPLDSQTFWGFMNSAPDFTSIAALFTIVIGAGIVAGEFSSGTIKLLLIRPVSRYKILFSKYISTLLFALFLICIMVISSFVIGIILFGFDGIELPSLTFTDGKVIERNMITQTLLLYGIQAVDLVMMVTFAFMVSTVFRSNSLAIGISIFLMFTGQQLVMLFNDYNWVKYILFANTNLNQFFNGTPMVEGMTLTFSLIVLSIYYIFFLVISWIMFNFRDVDA